MKRFTIGLFICLLCFSLTSGITENNQDDNKTLDPEIFLKRHNYYRAQLGIAPVEWSDDLADYAQEWADKLTKTCKMKHRGPDDYGENIYWTSDPVDEYKVVDKWAGEKGKFNHKRKTFQSGKGYGHYTQMIWEETTHIGAAVANCKNGAQIWVCNYNPPGNYIGEKVFK